MSSPLLSGLPDAKSSSRFVAKTLGLVGAIILVTLGASIAAVIWSTDIANRRESERQLGRVQSALAAELKENTRQLSALVTNSEFRRQFFEGLSIDALSLALAREAARSGRFDGIYILGVDGQLRAGVESINSNRNLVHSEFKDRPDGDVLYTSSSLFRYNTNIPKSFVRSNVYENDKSIFILDGRRLIALTKIVRNFSDLSGEPASNSFFVTGYRVISDSYLQEISSRHNIMHFQLTSNLSSETSHAITIENVMGTPGPWLVWSSERPGDELLRRFIIVIVLALGICLAVFVIILSRLRRSALQMSIREDEIQRLAGFDSLSGLPNRKAFEITIDRELEKLAKNGIGFAVHFLDLDKFKAVNDTYGHKAGDELIRQVAKRLTDLLRGADTLVRLGGDEFAIVQTEVIKAGEAAMLGQRILEALTRPFTIDDVQVLIGVSIGISLAPQNGVDRETLENLADAALYQAKNDGRNRYSFFEKMMDKSLHLRRVVEDDLRNAIDNGDLTLHYQPQISADGQTIVGIEALVRWPHAIHGMIPPTEFIPIAEERGLIMQLSDWVLRRACSDGLRWPNLRLAVNVSPIQFRHHDFVANVAAVLSETGFDGSRLEIELTEGVVVDDADKAEAAMFELRALGVGLALDDFGTGYSSLIYLRRFAFDKIKIDRSFLEYMETTGESAILVHSVVHLGRALGLRVCAEGVETAEQHRFLQAVGCHELQGFYFSPPVSADTIDHLLTLENPFETRAN